MGEDPERPRILWHAADVIRDTGALHVEVDDTYEEWVDEFQVRLDIRRNETQAHAWGPIEFDGRYIRVGRVLGREEAVRAELERLLDDAHAGAMASLAHAGRARTRRQEGVSDAERSEQRFRGFGR